MLVVYFHIAISGGRVAFLLKSTWPKKFQRSKEKEYYSNFNTLTLTNREDRRQSDSMQYQEKEKYEGKNLNMDSRASGRRAQAEDLI